MPLGLSWGRPFKPFSRAISSRSAAFSCSSPDTRSRSCNTTAFSSASEILSRSRSAVPIPRGNHSTTRAMVGTGRRGRSGGVLIWRRRDGDAVGGFDAFDDHWQLIFALQPSPRLGCGHDQLEDRESCRSLRQTSRGAHGPVPNGGKDALDRVRGAQMVPMLGGEVEEGQQRLTLLRQAVDGLGIFGLIFVDEDGHRGLGGGPVWRVADFPEVSLHVGLNRLRRLVEHVEDLVLPAALMTGRWKDLLERFPETERAVADSNPRHDRKATSLQVDEQFTPALRTFAHDDLEADQFLPTFRRRAYEDQHASGIVLHARLKINAISPDVDIVAGRQVAALPADIVILPLLLQAPDRRWRQVRRVATQKRAERFLEIAGRDASQVENRYESVEALRATCPFRQERRGEGDAVLAGSFRGSITQLGPLDRHRTNPRLDHPFRPVAMAHQTAAPIRQALLGHGGKKRLGLRLDGL